MSNSQIIPTGNSSDLPSYTIKVDGAEITETVQVVSILVTREVNRIATAELIILDGNPAAQAFEVSSSNDFLPNKEIQLEMGYHSDEKVVFKGKIIKHGISILENRHPVLKVECKDISFAMTIGRKNTYFYDSKDSEIMERVIGNSSFTGTKEVEATQLKHPEMVQYNCTDWDFMLSRAEANGLFTYTDDGKIIIKKPDFGQEPKLTVSYGNTIYALEAEMDARTQYKKVNAYAWDSSSHEMLESSGGDPGTTTPGNISNSKLGDVSGVQEVNLNHAGQLKVEELKGWADAQMLKSHLSKVRGRVRITGFNDIKPGDMLEMEGLGDRFNGKAFVSGVRHEMSNGTYQTDINFGINPEWFYREHDDIQVNAANGLLPAVNGLTIGIVTKLEEDPDGQNRIRVRMPMIDSGGEGIWARIATLDAGNQRGTFFLPEINDEVIVGFLNDDPRNPIILGQLHSGKNPAPFEAKDDNHEKGYVSRENIKLTFNDEKKSVILETPGGKIFTMDDDAKVVTIEDENGNKIKMDADGITLDSSKDIILKATGDLKGDGVNVEMKAQANFKAEGSAGAEVSSSGQMVVKGAIVQIN